MLPPSIWDKKYFKICYLTQVESTRRLQNTRFVNGHGEQTSEMTQNEYFQLSVVEGWSRTWNNYREESEWARPSHAPETAQHDNGNHQTNTFLKTLPWKCVQCAHHTTKKQLQYSGRYFSGLTDRYSGTMCEDLVLTIPTKGRDWTMVKHYYQRPS